MRKIKRKWNELKSNTGTGSIGKYSFRKRERRLGKGRQNVKDSKMTG